MTAPTPLITKLDIAQWLDLSNSATNDALKPHILSAQISDLAPLLGEKLYNAIIFNPEDHTELLDGGEYTIDGHTYMSYGLKTVLAHYAYARYRMFGRNKDTPFNVVQKISDGNSVQTSYAELKTEYVNNNSIAFTYFESVREYLIRNKYELYDCPTLCNPERKGSGLLRISKII